MNKKLLFSLNFKVLLPYHFLTKLWHYTDCSLFFMLANFTEKISSTVVLLLLCMVYHQQKSDMA